MSGPGAVQYAGVETMLALIRLRGAEAFLSGLALAIEHDFKRWEQFEKSPRIPSYSADGVIELMPTSDGAFYAFKYVNGHPGNTGLGLPTVAGFGVLADVRTGLPVLFSEMTIATAMRTAATSAMAAKHLARSDSQVMAMIGLGAQSEFQALAFKAVLGVKRLRAFDIDAGAVRKLVANLEGFGFDVNVVGSVHEATLGADVVTTATAVKARQHLITPDMVRPGTHFNAIGGDGPGKTEIHPDALRAAKIFIEYREQTRIEGEIQQMPADVGATELWRVIAGAAPGRTREDDVTLFDFVGFAIEDFSTLRYVQKLLLETGLGERLDIVPRLERPEGPVRLAEGGGAMKTHFQMFAHYNAWANARVLTAAAALDDAQYREDCGAFFKSMHGTLNHLLLTDRVWMNRFTGEGPTYTRLDQILCEDFESLAMARATEDARIARYVDGLEEAAFAGRFRYKRVTTDEWIEQELSPALAHVFNHQTHHRGQAHVLLTSLTGKAPELDLLYFQRATARAKG